MQPGKRHGLQPGKRHGLQPGKRHGLQPSKRHGLQPSKRHGLQIRASGFGGSILRARRSQIRASGFGGSILRARRSQIRASEIQPFGPPLGGMVGKTKERDEATKRLSDGATKRQGDGANGRTVEWLIEVRFLRESTRSAGNKKVPKFQSSNVPVVQSSIVQNTSLVEAQYW